MAIGHDEGTIMFWFGHKHPDWPSNTNTYNFGPFAVHDAGAEVGIVKESDGVLHFTIKVHGRTFRHEQATACIITGRSPDGAITHGMFFALMWSPKTVTLNLGGGDDVKKVATFRV